MSSKSTILAAALSLGTAFGAATGAVAGTITGGTLLDGAGANQLEAWLGVGDQDFTNIFAGNAGVATATAFHSAVDGVGPTFSIYDVTLDSGNGPSVKIGGYTALDWGGVTGYQSDATAFIFNLTTGEAQFTQHYSGIYSINRAPNYFATFGGGHDIFAGYGVLGTCNGGLSAICDGYTQSHSYDQAQGQISIAGDSGSGSGDSGFDLRHIVVNSLEVYTFEPAVAPVPLPAGGLLLLTALGGLAVARRRRG
ncbi:MAG: PEP_CTERM-anchored TLD domain-containing protein [Rhodobacteraceae bacterium]|nr:PEP_CTERM-anchored TLD domain-containing protein [Paracoccaceae bacterium]